MILVEDLIKNKSKKERQEHLDLSTPCKQRGGNSTNHKGVLAQYLDTNIPYGIKFPLCHACHNGKCSNPKHLYWGTVSENNRDAIENGRPTTKGLRRPMSEETKLKIRATNLAKKLVNNPLGINGISTGKQCKGGYTYTQKTKQFWVTNGEINLRLKKDSIIPEGFRKGRIINGRK